MRKEKKELSFLYFQLLRKQRMIRSMQMEVTKLSQFRDGILSFFNLLFLKKTKISQNRIVREVLERNISTIEYVELELRFVPENTFPQNSSIIEEIKALIDVSNKRDESIQFLMKIMDEKFRKVWKLPWELAQIIHGFTWNKEDVRDISSKVSLIPLHGNRALSRYDCFVKMNRS